MSAGEIAAAVLAASPKYNGCAELLKRFALFRAARVGGKKARDLCQHRQLRGRRSGARAHGRPELANEQNGSRLAGIVGCLPVPSAVSVGGAKGGFHRRAQRRRVDALTALEMRKKMVRGPGHRSDLRDRTGCNGKRRGRTSGHGDGSRCDGENLERAGRIEPRGALSRPRRLKSVPARLYRVAGGGRPPPAPTQRGVRISRTKCGQPIGA
jgi:hypothetical protein